LIFSFQKVFDILFERGEEWKYNILIRKVFNILLI